MTVLLLAPFLFNIRFSLVSFRMFNSSIRTSCILITPLSKKGFVALLFVIYEYVKFVIVYLLVYSS